MAKGALNGKRNNLHKEGEMVQKENAINYIKVKIKTRQNIISVIRTRQSSFHATPLPNLPIVLH